MRLFFLLCAFSVTALFGQEIAPYNQFHTNPFFYNASFASDKKQAEVSLTYRQQWAGLSGAPKFSNLLMLLPLNKIAFVLNIQNNTRGILTNTSAQLAIIYKAQLSSYASLSFGFSAGIGRSSLDISQVDPNDPLVATTLSNSFSLNGQTGINFQFKTLALGVSFPQIFDNVPNNSQAFQRTQLNPFRLIVASARVKFPSTGKVKFEPIFISKTMQGVTTMEAYGVFHIGDPLRAGLLWRQNFGAAGLLGFDIAKALSINYSFEVPIGLDSSLAYNTHEFNLSVKFGQPHIDAPAPKNKLPKDLKRR